MKDFDKNKEDETGRMGIKNHGNGTVRVKSYVNDTEERITLAKENYSSFIISKLKHLCCYHNRIEPEKNFSRKQKKLVKHLTEKECYNFEKVWKMVQPHLAQIGRNTVINLFEDNPEILVYFDKFKSKSLEMLKDDIAIEVHGLVLMSTLDEIVCHLDEGEELIEEILEEIGQSHARFGTNMSSDHFWLIEEPLIRATTQKLGTLPKKAEILFKKVVRFIISGTVRGFEKELLCRPNFIRESGRACFTSQKKVGLNELIEKDIEEKISEHHKNHHHHHHHRHHSHHRGNEMSFSDLSNVSAISSDWALRSINSINHRYVNGNHKLHHDMELLHNNYHNLIKEKKVDKMNLVSGNSKDNFKVLNSGQKKKFDD